MKYMYIIIVPSMSTKNVSSRISVDSVALAVTNLSCECHFQIINCQDIFNRSNIFVDALHYNVSI